MTAPVSVEDVASKELIPEAGGAPACTYHSDDNNCFKDIQCTSVNIKCDMPRRYYCAQASPPSLCRKYAVSI